MKWQKSGSRRFIVAMGLAALGSSLVIAPCFAQSSETCRAYAEDYSNRYSADSILGQAILAGGRRAGASALAANRSRRLQRATLFENAYSRCMRGLWP